MALHRAVKKYNEWKLSRKMIPENKKTGVRRTSNAKRKKKAG